MYEPPDYDAIELTRWRKNAVNVIDLLEQADKNLLKKIDTFASNFDYEVDDVINQIRKDTMFAATFAVDPKKQSFHEAVAAEWLKENLAIEIIVLPKSGDNAMYVTRDGDVRTYSNRRKPSKSLDFTWQVEKYTFYAMHKYTKGDGGAQGNQSRELMTILQNFSSAQNESLVFIAIADGSHYSESKMKQLRSETRDNAPKSFVAHIEEVPDIVKEYR